MISFDIHAVTIFDFWRLVADYSTLIPYFNVFEFVAGFLLENVKTFYYF